MDVKATFSTEDVKELVKARFIRLFGPVIEGYTLDITEYYGEYKAYMSKNEPVEPEPSLTEQVEDARGTITANSLPVQA